MQFDILRGCHTKARSIVIPTATHNTVTTTTNNNNNNSSTTHVSPIVIPARQLNLPAKRFNKHNYHELTPSEIHKIPKNKFKCVGMQFTDDSDPLDTATGVVTSIVRHKKIQNNWSLNIGTITLRTLSQLILLHSSTLM